MADVCVFSFLRLAGLDSLRRIFPLENLHASLFVDADDEPAFMIETKSVEIQLTDVPGFQGTIGVMAMQPIHTPMGFEVGGIENPPEGRAAHGRG